MTSRFALPPPIGGLSVFYTDMGRKQIALNVVVSGDPAVAGGVVLLSGQIKTDSDI